MHDLISRAYVLAEYDRQHKGPPGGARKIIEDAPAVDAVPVMRCRNCIHCFNTDSDPMEPYDGEAHWYCDEFDTDWNVLQLDPNRFYCANGDRRDDDV